MAWFLLPSPVFQPSLSAASCACRLPETTIKRRDERERGNGENTGRTTEAAFASTTLNIALAAANANPRRPLSFRGSEKFCFFFFFLSARSVGKAQMLSSQKASKFYARQARRCSASVATPGAPLMFSCRVQATMMRYDMSPYAHICGRRRISTEAKKQRMKSQRHASSTTIRQSSPPEHAARDARSHRYTIGLRAVRGALAQYAAARLSVYSRHVHPSPRAASI